MPAPATALEAVLRSIPDGPLWVTAKRLRELVQALIRDRAVLADGSGSEIPTKNGRQFLVTGGTGTVPAEFAIVGGRVGTYQVQMKFVEFTDGL